MRIKPCPKETNRTFAIYFTVTKMLHWVLQHSSHITNKKQNIPLKTSAKSILTKPFLLKPLERMIEKWNITFPIYLIIWLHTRVFYLPILVKSSSQRWRDIMEENFFHVSTLFFFFSPHFELAIPLYLLKYKTQTASVSNLPSSKYF